MSPIISLKPYLQWLRDSEIIWDRKSRKEKQKLVPRQHQGHDAEAQNQRWVQSTSNKFTAQTSAWYERNLWYVINWQIPSILYIYQAALLASSSPTHHRLEMMMGRKWLLTPTATRKRSPIGELPHLLVEGPCLYIVSSDRGDIWRWVLLCASSSVCMFFSFFPFLGFSAFLVPEKR